MEVNYDFTIVFSIIVIFIMFIVLLYYLFIAPINIPVSENKNTIYES
jgi:hypothetical protein